MLVAIAGFDGCAKDAHVPSVLLGGGSAAVIGDSLTATSRTEPRVCDLGVRAYLDGKLQLAERLLRTAFLYSHRDTTALSYLVKCYLAKDSPEGRREAEDALESLTILAPDRVEYVRAIADLRRQRGFYYNAKKSFTKLIDRKMRDPDVFWEVGRMAEEDYWRFQRRDLRDAALRFYGEALACDPGHEDAHVRLAVIALEEDSLAVAASHVETLLATRPRELTTVLLDGIRHERVGDFETAERLFRDAIARMPGFDQRVYLDPRLLEPDTLLMLSEVALDPGFWQKRDPTAGTAANERFAVHAERVAMADFLYGRAEKNYRGWETAPGEFYIRYGKPVRRAYANASGRNVALQTFRVGGYLETLRFEDYALSGRFYNPIEYTHGAIPTFAWLRIHKPENGQLAKRVPVREIPRRAAWFRARTGEPRLEIVLADSLGDRSWRVVARDSAWAETERGAETLTPVACPEGVPNALPGVFVADLYPGENARHVAGTLGSNAQATLELGPPPARTGFTMSDLVLGFSTPAGFVANPGYDYTAAVELALRFEVYDYFRDPSGRGYLQFTLSLVPLESERLGLAAVLGGPKPKPYVASQIDEETLDPSHERTLSIDLSRLEPGTYEVTAEVTDIIRHRTVQRSTRFAVRGT